jgi:hypothetical protein
LVARSTVNCPLHESDRPPSGAAAETADRQYKKKKR